MTDAEVVLVVAAPACAEVVVVDGDGDETEGDDVADVDAPPAFDVADLDVADFDAADFDAAEFVAEVLADLDDAAVAECVSVEVEDGTLSGEPHAATVSVSTVVAARAARRVERDTQRSSAATRRACPTELCYSPMAVGRTQ